MPAMRAAGSAAATRGESCRRGSRVFGVLQDPGPGWMPVRRLGRKWRRSIDERGPIGIEDRRGEVAEGLGVRPGDHARGRRRPRREAVVCKLR